MDSELLTISVLIFLFVISAQPMLSGLAKSLGWLDKPDERKTHRTATPVVGGMAIVCGLGLAAYLGAWPESAIGLGFAILLIFVMGFWDDLSPLKAGHRFVGQTIAAAIAVTFSSTLLTNAGDVFWPAEFSLSYFALPITIFLMVGLINAFNMSDGVDGLCAGYAAVALFWVGASAALVYSQSQAANGLVSLASVSFACIGGFLIYNMRYPGHRRASVFLGDNGSTVLGLIVGWVLIRAIGSPDDQVLHPVAAAYIVALPLADTISSIFRRVRSGVSPTTADRHHIHHLLMAHRLSVRRAVFSLNLFSLMLGGFGILAWRLGFSMPVLFWALVLGICVYIVYAEIFWKRYSLNTATASLYAERAKLRTEN